MNKQGAPLQKTHYHNDMYQELRPNGGADKYLICQNEKVVEWIYNLQWNILLLKHLSKLYICLIYKRIAMTWVTC